MVEQVETQKGRGAFSPREFLLKYLKYLPWLILSVLLLLTLAWLKLRYTNDIFEVRAKMIIKNENSFGGQDKLSNMFMMDQPQNLSDEIQILKSTGLSKRVVQDLGLQISYVTLGNVKSHILHPKESPFLLDIIQLKDTSRSFGFEIKYLNETTFNIDNIERPVFFGQTIENDYGRFRFIKRPTSYLQYGTNLFRVNWRPLDDVAAVVAETYKIGTVNDFSNVLLITFETENPKLGRDIVNQLMEEYNVLSVEDKRTITTYTLQFIDEQLDKVKKELGGVEQNLQTYREENRAIDLEEQAVISFNELSASNQTLATQEVQLKIIDYLIGYLADQRNSNKTVPASLGIQEPSLQVLINEYNATQLKRQTQLQSTTEANPIIRDLDADISTLRQQIAENLSNIRQSYVINRNNLLAKSRKVESEISSVPGKGRKMLEITRQQKILEELYSFLLQKKLETSISSAATISNSKVVEPAKPSEVPVKPDRKGMYILALFVGMGVPVGIIVLKEYLNDKITNRFDVERLTPVPVLGEIGHSEQTGTLVVTKNNRRFISEQFRIIRTNLQYILHKVDKPVLLVTSSFSGEGKSFVSTNVGAVLALTGRKTVILEFDIRKPKIIAGLELGGSKLGISNFIVGSASIQQIILPVTKVDNLYVIPCGPIPPNPAELLLDDKVKELFDYLKLHFDAIIIDSAPIGLVSDAITLSVYADATLYITRQNYTFKKQMNLVNDIYNNKKLPKVSILLNDVKHTGGYGSYYGNYGYGYSYGQSGEYFEEEGKTSKGILARIKGWFS